MNKSDQSQAGKELDKILLDILDKFEQALTKISLTAGSDKDFADGFMRIKLETVKAIHDSYDWRQRQEAVEEFAERVDRAISEGKFPNNLEAQHQELASLKANKGRDNE